MDPKAQQLYNEIQSLLNMAFARVNDLSALYNERDAEAKELATEVENLNEDLDLLRATNESYEQRVKELESSLNGQADEPETDKLLKTPDGGDNG